MEATGLQIPSHKYDCQHEFSCGANLYVSACEYHLVVLRNSNLCEVMRVTGMMYSYILQAIALHSVHVVNVTAERSVVTFRGLLMSL